MSYTPFAVLPTTSNVETHPFAIVTERLRGVLTFYTEFECVSFVCVIFPLQKALRTGTSTRLDERVFAMCEFKSQPLKQIMRMIHPDLFRIDNLTEQVTH